MTTTERASLITDLYALRSQAGALFVRANQEHQLSVGAQCAIARDAITEAIHHLSEKQNANTTSPAPRPDSPGQNAGTKS